MKYNLKTFPRLRIRKIVDEETERIVDKRREYDDHEIQKWFNGFEKELRHHSETPIEGLSKVASAYVKGAVSFAKEVLGE